MSQPPGILGIDQQRSVQLDPIAIAQHVIERSQLSPHADPGRISKMVLRIDRQAALIDRIEHRLASSEHQRAAHDLTCCRTEGDFHANVRGLSARHKPEPHA